MLKNAAAAAWALMGGLYNSGQDCTCGSRLYVQSTVYDRFLEIMKEKVKEYKLGDGFDPESNSGPLVGQFMITWVYLIRLEQISKSQFDKVNSYIESGIEAGATPFIYGREKATKGYFVDPVGKSQLL